MQDPQASKWGKTLAVHYAAPPCGRLRLLLSWQIGKETPRIVSAVRVFTKGDL